MFRELDHLKKYRNFNFSCFFVFIFSGFIFFSQNLAAQDSIKVNSSKKSPLFDPTLKSFFAVSPMIGFPIKEFREGNNFNSGIGISLRGAYRVFKDKPVLLGLSVEYFLYHKAQANGVLSYSNGSSDEIRTNVNNNIFSSHLFLHFQPNLGKIPVFPFVEGLAGFRHFYSKANVIRRFDNKDLDSFNLQKSFALSYGGAAGISIPIGESELEFRLVYLTTPPVKYVTGKSVLVFPPYGVDYETRESITPTLFLQIGFMFSNL